jgi:zinc transporter ZupT
LNAYEGAALIFAEGAALGAAAISGATLLAFSLIFGFTICNVVKGTDLAARTRFTEPRPNARRILMIGCFASLPIIPGMMLGYGFANAAFATFFFAIATGAITYVVGEIAASIFAALVGGWATNADPESQQSSSAFTLGGLR